jgi:hypothetical protein
VTVAIVSTPDALVKSLDVNPDDRTPLALLADYWGTDAAPVNPAFEAGYRAILKADLAPMAGRTTGWFSWDDPPAGDRSCLPWRWRLGVPSGFGARVNSQVINRWWDFPSPGAAYRAAAESYPGPGRLCVMGGTRAEADHWFEQWGYPGGDRLYLDPVAGRLGAGPGVHVVRVGDRRRWNTSARVGSLVAAGIAATEWVMTDAATGKTERVS